MKCRFIESRGRLKHPFRRPRYIYFENAQNTPIQTVPTAKTVKGRDGRDLPQAAVQANKLPMYFNSVMPLNTAIATTTTKPQAVIHLGWR